MFDVFVAFFRFLGFEDGIGVLADDDPLPQDGDPDRVHVPPG